MKRVFYSLLIAATCASSADAQVRMPQPSPLQTIKQDFGISSIELSYSRPSLKGRKMMGVMDKYGVVWRTGANAATRIRFNDRVEIGGKMIDTGSYALYTIPQKQGDWTVIINKGIGNWGTNGFKESDDVVRFTAKTTKLKPKMETLTMQFANMRPQTCDLQIMWEDFMVTIPIKTNFVDKVGAQLKEAMKGEKPPYWEAAQFYYEYGNDLQQALTSINKAIEVNAARKPFWMYHYKAKIQKDLGDKTGATATANESIRLAKEAQNDVYVTMNEQLLRSMK
jgi:hypothetical protein